MKPKEEVIRIDELQATEKSEQIDTIAPKQIDIKKLKIIRRENRLDTYFNITTIISMIIVALYSLLIIRGQDVPEYLTFFVGGILAYFLLKHPHDS